MVIILLFVVISFGGVGIGVYNSYKSKQLQTACSQVEANCKTLQKNIDNVSIQMLKGVWNWHYVIGAAAFLFFFMFNPT